MSLFCSTITPVLNYIINYLYLKFYFSLNVEKCDFITIKYKSNSQQLADLRPTSIFGTFNAVAPF